MTKLFLSSLPLIGNVMVITMYYIRLIEDWRLKLDNDQIVGAILMDLWIYDLWTYGLMDLWIMNRRCHPYGFDEKSLIFIYSYLKRRDKCVRINNIYNIIYNIIILIIFMARFSLYLLVFHRDRYLDRSFSIFT